MRLICLADTHNLHHEIPVPEGDILIHAGDATDGGTRNESLEFLEWFSTQPHQYKIFVPGNHDFYFEKEESLEIIPPNVEVLIDGGLEIEGIKFWGSPMTPGNANWAFNRERGADIRSHWDLIPKDTNILITHSPPYGILDEIGSGIKLGCEELSERIDIVQPDLHLFGHIHHSAGQTSKSGTRFFNLSLLDERLRVMHSPLKLIL